MSSHPTLLCVAPYTPWSGIDHAGGLYVYHYLTEFSRLGWQVQHVAPRSPENEHARDRLAESDPAIEVRLLDVPSHSKLRTRLTMLLTGRDGVSPARWTGAPELASMARSADLIDLQWHDIYGYAGWFAKAAPRTPVVVLAHDLRSQSVARNAHAARGLKRLALGWAVGRVEARERTELAHCARLLAFKKSDLRAARSHGVDTPGLIAPPYVALEEGDVSPDATSRTMVFPAAFFRTENSEAAHWFLDSVWPLVRATVPDARVCFAGSRPPADLLARADEDVVFTGYLPSLLDGYRGALLAVAPLRRGAGLKFKVVQAMALGYPVVGTTIAMEGLEDFLPDSVPEAFDNERDFAERIITILQDPGSSLAQGAALATVLRDKLVFGRAMSEMSREFAGLVGPAEGEEM